MLSVTNTINDMKAKLRKGFAFYGFADDAEFVTALTSSVDDNKLEIMYPALTIASQNSTTVVHGLITTDWRSNNLESGRMIYNDIAAKDKVGLDIFEEYIYWAEVWCSMSSFMSDLNEDDTFSRTGSSQSISTKGYSASVSGNIDVTGKSQISSKYATNGNDYLVLAGINMYARPRSGR